MVKKLLITGLAISCLALLLAGCLDFETPPTYNVEGEWKTETFIISETVWIKFEEVEDWDNTGEIHFVDKDLEFQLSYWEWDSLNQELTGQFLYETNGYSQTWRLEGEFQDLDELYIRFYSTPGSMVDAVFHRQ